MVNISNPKALFWQDWTENGQILVWTSNCFSNCQCRMENKTCPSSAASHTNGSPQTYVACVACCGTRHQELSGHFKEQSPDLPTKWRPYHSPTEPVSGPSTEVQFSLCGHASHTHALESYCRSDRCPALCLVWGFVGGGWAWWWWRGMASLSECVHTSYHRSNCTLKSLSSGSAVRNLLSDEEISQN